MDVGIFKASNGRLRAWLIIPPLLIVSVGLGSFAWQQRAQWKLKEANALSEVLPSFIAVRKDAANLFEIFNAVGGGELSSEGQLISFLQERAQQNEFLMDTVSVLTGNKQQKAVPVLNAIVRGSGSLTAIQLYINDVKTEQRLLSVSSIKITQPSEGSNRELYHAEIVFELLLLSEMKAFNGGIQ